METIILQKSTRLGKRYMVKINNKTIHFGSSEHENFTIHKDEQRKERYIARHKARENWNDINTAGYWSRWLLWSKPTLEESIRDINKKQNKYRVVSMI